MRALLNITYQCVKNTHIFSDRKEEKNMRFQKEENTKIRFEKDGIYIMNSKYQLLRLNQNSTLVCPHLFILEF